MKRLINVTANVIFDNLPETSIEVMPNPFNNTAKECPVLVNTYDKQNMRVTRIVCTVEEAIRLRESLDAALEFLERLKVEK